MELLESCLYIVSNTVMTLHSYCVTHFALCARVADWATWWYGKYKRIPLCKAMKCADALLLKNLATERLVLDNV